MTFADLRNELRDQGVTLTAARIGAKRRWVAALTTASGNRILGTGTELSEAVENAMAAWKRRSASKMVRRRYVS